MPTPSPGRPPPNPTKHAERDALTAAARFEENLARRWAAPIQGARVDAETRPVVGLNSPVGFPDTYLSLLGSSETLRELVFPSRNGAPTKLPWGLFTYEWPKARAKLQDDADIEGLLTRLGEAMDAAAKEPEKREPLVLRGDDLLRIEIALLATMRPDRFMGTGDSADELLMIFSLGQALAELPGGSLVHMHDEITDVLAEDLARPEARAHMVKAARALIVGTAIAWAYTDTLPQ